MFKFPFSISLFLSYYYFYVPRVTKTKKIQNWNKISLMYFSQSLSSLTENEKLPSFLYEAFYSCDFFSLLCLIYLFFIYQ